MSSLSKQQFGSQRITELISSVVIEIYQRMLQKSEATPEVLNF